VKEFKLPVPPKEEQKNICQYIQGLESKTSRTIEKEIIQTQSLKTLRSTLIAHAVTGKIKV
jgi:type I restriction enzyme S subunit